MHSEVNRKILLSDGFEFRGFLCSPAVLQHVLKPDGDDVSTKDGSDIQCDPDPHETHQMLGFWTVRNSKSVL